VCIFEYGRPMIHAKSGLFQGENFRRDLAKVEELKRFAADRGHTVAQLAVACTLSNPAVDVAIVGARGPDQTRVLPRPRSSTSPRKTCARSRT